MEYNLGTYLVEQQFEGVAVNNYRWVPEHGRIVVNALVEGPTPHGFQIQIVRTVEIDRVVDIPQGVLKSCIREGEINDT